MSAPKLPNFDIWREKNALAESPANVSRLPRGGFWLELLFICDSVAEGIKGSVFALITIVVVIVS